MSMKWVLIAFLFVGVGVATADVVVHDGVEVDRDKLWNPMTGYTPWTSPVGYKVEEGHAHDVHGHDVDNVEKIEPIAQGRIADEVKVCDENRDHLWNPFHGEHPWLGDAHTYIPRY